MYPSHQDQDDNPGTGETPLTSSLSSPSIHRSLALIPLQFGAFRIEIPTSQTWIRFPDPNTAHPSHLPLNLSVGSRTAPHPLPPKLPGALGCSAGVGKGGEREGGGNFAWNFSLPIKSEREAVAGGRMFPVTGPKIIVEVT